MAGTEAARFEGASWDLASSVGATATAVAARRALASKGPNPLIDDPYAEPLVRAVGVETLRPQRVHFPGGLDGSRIQ
jgi:O-methyltransferase involved in polyketide biosynthesis